MVPGGSADGGFRWACLLRLRPFAPLAAAWCIETKDFGRSNTYHLGIIHFMWTGLCSAFMFLFVSSIDSSICGPAMMCTCCSALLTVSVPRVVRLVLCCGILVSCLVTFCFTLHVCRTGNLDVPVHRLFMQSSCLVSSSSPVCAVPYPGLRELGLFSFLNKRLYGMLYDMCKPYCQFVYCLHTTL